MPYYESVFIARQDITVQQTEALADQLSDVIVKTGGKVTKRENWGLRNLAYRIKKNRKGHYILLNIDGPSDAVKEYERQMRINEDVLRYLTVKVEELDTKPSVILSEGSDSRVRRPKMVADSFDDVDILDIDQDLEEIFGEE